MSEVDRRRHEPICDYLEGDMEPAPHGKWFHESAVRELVEELQEEHTEAVEVESHIEEAADYPAHDPSKCHRCQFLTHYKELLDE